MKVCNYDCFDCFYDDCIIDDCKRSVSGDKKLGNRIRTARMKTGLSQKQLAKLIGVRNVTISLWETGASGISGENMEKLESFFPELRQEKNLKKFKKRY